MNGIDSELLTIFIDEAFELLFQPGFSTARRLSKVSGRGVEGQQEYVTNALSWNLISVPAVNGAIIRPDGRLAVSLDVRHLYQKGYQLSHFTAQSDTDTSASKTATRILVVDDSSAARTLGIRILKEGGYAVETASDGSEALEILLQSDFDLVVSDVDIPKMDGLSLTRNIRSNPKLKDVPVILVTSKSSDEDRRDGADAGADEYVVKGSFDQRFLLNLVSKYV